MAQKHSETGKAQQGELHAIAEGTWGRTRLLQLLDVRQMRPTPANLKALAEELPHYSSDLRGCSYSYLRSVLSGTVEGSPALLATLESAIDVTNGHHPLMQGVEQVMVWAPKGQLPPGTLVLGQVLHCKGCGIGLVSSNPKQAWCPACSPYVERGD